MTDVAEKLGCKQNQITQIEQGKTNPSPEFLRKCLEVYKIPEAEKADFIAQALASSNRLILEMDKVTIIPKDDLAKLMTVLAFNLKEPYPDKKEWGAVVKAINELLKGINERNQPFTVIR
jgi:transcriptional regulator with XRE-family HTH domain